MAKALFAALVEKTCPGIDEASPGYEHPLYVDEGQHLSARPTSNGPGMSGKPKGFFMLGAQYSFTNA
jgi:hypothetical protein